MGRTGAINQFSDKGQMAATANVMPTLRHWSKVDLAKVVFKEAKRNANGGLNVEIGYSNDAGLVEKLWIQGPKMRIPFGPASSAQFADRNSVAPPNFTLDCALNGLRNGDPTMTNFEIFCEQWDDLVVKAAIQNSILWFGKERSEVTIRELIKPMLKQPKDMRYDPTIKIKLPKRWGNWDFQVFDQNKNIITADDLTVGNEVIPVFEMKYVWFVGNSFGISMDARQMQCFVKEELKQFIIMEPTDDAPPAATFETNTGFV